MLIRVVASYFISFPQRVVEAAHANEGARKIKAKIAQEGSENLPGRLKSKPNRSKIAPECLRSDLGRIGTLLGRSGDAPGTLQDALGTPQDAPKMLSGRSGMLPGHSRDGPRHSLDSSGTLSDRLFALGARGIVFRSMCARVFDEKTVVFLIDRT